MITMSVVVDYWQALLSYVALKKHHLALDVILVTDNVVRLL